MNRYFKNSPTRRKFFRAEAWLRCRGLAGLSQSALFAALLLAAPCADVQAQSRNAANPYPGERITSSFFLPAGDTLSLTGPVTQLEITRSATDSVHFVEILHFAEPVLPDHALSRVQFTLRQTANKTTLRARPARLLISRSWQIQIPPGRLLVVQMQGGDVRVTRFTGWLHSTLVGGSFTVTQFSGELAGRVTGGAMQLYRSHGEIRISTTGGGVLMDSLAGRITATVTGGSLRAHRLFGRATLRVTGGNLKLSRAAAPVRAEVRGGDLSVQSASDSLALKTAAGDVVLREISAPVQADSRGGTITAQGLADGFSLTASGDIRLKQAQGSGVARSAAGEIMAGLLCRTRPGHLSLHANGGAIFLRLPERCPVSVQARITLPRNRSKRDFTIESGLPLQLRREEKQDRVILSGEYHDRSDLRWQINLETSAANIRITTGAKNQR